MDELFVGIDGGSIAIKAAVADGNGEFVYEAPYTRHQGQVARSIEQVLGELYEKYPDDIADVSFTGYNTIGIAKALGAKHFPDAVAQKKGVLRLHPDVGAVVSFGGQGSGLMLFRDGEEFDTALNSACAAGAGAFLDRQAVRNYESQLGNLRDPTLKIDEALRLFIEEGMKSQNPPRVAGRCPVFAESDTIHMTNTGVPKADIFAGATEALARTCASDLRGQKEIPEGEQLLIGGGSRNALLLRFLRNFFPKLAVPEYATSMQAYGAALLGMRSGIRHVFPISDLERKIVADSIDRAPQLVISRSILPEEAPLEKGLYKEAFLGIDVGSTTTKCILYALDEHGVRRIIHKEYIKTEGALLTAVNKLLATIQSTFTNLKILGVGVTGSGRMVAGSFVGADVIVNEITAHAKAAVYHNPKVKTVIEIGGQDSKYIQIIDGHPVDFTMNKACAAGTGSFLEKLAIELGIDINGEFERLALSAGHPVVLSEKCTVFTYSAVTSALRNGASRAEICAGLAKALAENYKNLVVGHRPIGEDVMFLGGPSRNKAVVAALEQLLPDSTITVPPHSEVFGAFGAAMCAEEKMRESGMPESAFRGFGIISEQPSHRSVNCRRCDANCTLDVYAIRNRAGGFDNFVFGGTCGEHETGPPGVAKATDYSLESRALFEEMIRVRPRNGATQRKVLLPRHLYMHQLGVLWAHFFNALGIQPVFGRETTGEMIELGMQSTPNSMCFSKIVSTGHIAAALRSIDDSTFLFLPTIVDAPSQETDGRRLYCPWVAASYYTAKAALSMDGKVLSPVIHFSESPQVLAYRMRNEFNSKLGVSQQVSQQQIQLALEEGLAHQREYEQKLTGIWEKAKGEIGDGPAMVVLGRPYMLGDKRLSLNIFSEIAKLGVPAMPMDILPLSGVDISKDYGNMYWALGERILKASRLIREDARLFPVYITNFGCGPDSFIGKYTSLEMAGKPGLDIELDMYTARAGMVTRLQAFIDVINSYLKNQNLVPARVS